MQVASKKPLLAGATATAALIVDGQLLVANVGDSKALLCSEKIPSGNNGDGNEARMVKFELLNP